jgi:hypothetical protein
MARSSDHEPRKENEMSGTGQTAAASALATQVASNVNGNWAMLVTDLTADGIGLLGEEAQDFDTFVDNVTQDVETGMTVSAAFEKEWAPYAAQARSDVWNAAMGALKQVVSLFDSFVKGIEALV